MIYVTILLHVAIFAFLGACLAGTSRNDLFIVIGVCTGAVIGAIIGATRHIVRELTKPDLTRQALYPRVLRDLEDEAND